MEFCEFCQNILRRTLFDPHGTGEYEKLEPFSDTVSRCRICELIYPLIGLSGGDEDDWRIIRLWAGDSTFIIDYDLVNPVGFIGLGIENDNVQDIRLAIWCDEGKQGPLTQLIFLFLTLSDTLNRKSCLEAT